MALKIIVGGDNAGFGYKEELKALLEGDDRVESVFDVGVGSADYGTFYPDIATAAAEKIAAGEADRALLICGTGLGVAIAANKVSGVRAVTAHDLYSEIGRAACRERDMNGGATGPRAAEHGVTV